MRPEGNKLIYPRYLNQKHVGIWPVLAYMYVCCKLPQPATEARDSPHGNFARRTMSALGGSFLNGHICSFATRALKTTIESCEFAFATAVIYVRVHVRLHVCASASVLRAHMKSTYPYACTHNLLWFTGLSATNVYETYKNIENIRTCRRIMSLFVSLKVIYAVNNPERPKI